MLRTAFICVFLCVGMYGAVRSRFAALLFYLWFAFFRPQEWVFFDLAAFHLSFIIALLLIVPSLASGVWPNATHPLSIGMLLFLAATLLSQLETVNAAVGWQWIEYLASLLCVALLSISMVRTRRQFLLTIAVITGSLGFHAAKAGLASLLAGGQQYAEGLAGPWIDNNGYALAGAMIVFPLIAVGQNVQRRYLRYLCYLTAALTVCTIISTYSREGFLALSSATVVFILLQRRRLMMIAVCSVVILIGVAVVPIPDAYLARLQTIQTYREVDDTSALSRLHFWQVGIAMAVDRPLGVGLRNFDEAYDRYDFLDGAFGNHRSVHSSHIQVLAETGFPGLAAWLGLFACSYWTGLKVRARAIRGERSGPEPYFDFTMVNALLASMTAFIIGGSFIALALNDLTWLTFALLAAVDRLSPDQAPVAATAFPVVGGNLSPVAGSTRWSAPSPTGAADGRIVPPLVTPTGPWHR